jgi:peroxiredoxin
MEIVLFTGSECSLCEQAEKAFKEKYAKELETGEANIVNLDEDENEKAQKFWMDHELEPAPCIVVVSENETLVTVLDTEKHLDIKFSEASPPATAEAGVIAAVESNG